MKFAIPFLVALSFVSCAAAHAEDITISGCVEKGVEGGCLIMKSGGKTYEINAATPKPVVGAYGTVTGTLATDMASTCMQGTIISPAKWTPDPTKGCGGK